MKKILLVLVLILICAALGVVLYRCGDTDGPARALEGR